MADSSARPSPDNSTPRRLELPSTHAGRLFRGPLASVYYHRQPPFRSGELTYSQAKVIITFECSVGGLYRAINGTRREEPLKGRRFVFLLPNTPHEIRWEREAELIEIYYEPAFLAELPSKNVAAILAHESHPRIAGDPVIWDLALAICQWCADGLPAETIINDIGLLIGRRLFSRHSETREKRRGQKFTSEQRGKLDAHIQEGMAKRLTVAQLAKAVSLSVPHFATLCRNTTGKPPMDYVRECRLWKAHAMARTGDYRRKEIARACGFYDGSHLNREFKKFFKHPLALLVR